MWGWYIGIIVAMCLVAGAAWFWPDVRYSEKERAECWHQDTH